MPDPEDPYGDPYREHDAERGDGDHDPQHQPEAPDLDDLSEPVQNDPFAAPQPPAYGPAHTAMRCQNCQADLAGATLGGHCPRCGTPIVSSGYPAGQSSGKAVASLVLGIISIPVCLCCGLLGVILGPLAIMFGKQAKNDIAAGTASPNSAGMASAGIICGTIGTVLGTVSLLLGVLGQLLPYLTNP